MATKRPATSVAAYRPDIDGLRAIAVVAVLFFHAFPKLFPGGFIGVDIFFVISGFLITGNINRGIESGSFSISGFYLRRVRRIFPALLIVLACCLIVGRVCLNPSEFMQLGKHTGAAAAFASNFFYWAESVQQKGLPHVDLHELSCNDSACPVLDEEGQLIFMDTSHRTFPGDAFVARRVRQDHVFERILDAK